MVPRDDDAYIIKIATLFGTYYWAESDTYIFTIHPLRAKQFCDLQSALDKARQLNLVLTSAANHRFHVALSDG